MLELIAENVITNLSGSKIIDTSNPYKVPPQKDLNSWNKISTPMSPGTPYSPPSPPDSYDSRDTDDDW